MSFDAEKIIPPGANIKVIGVGGGGGNAVNTMIRSNLEGVAFIAANTDVQALRFALPEYKIQIGKELTKGLGAGADPDVGRDAALEDRHEIQEALGGSDMVFITAGMGGGTGTGGASVIAQIAREMGALTVAVVTKPFHFEGKRRRKHAEQGIERLRECVDTLITIPNQRLLQIATPDLSMVDAFRMADEVLVNAVKGISDIINVPGTVNVDFADVKTVMSSMGLALMGIGTGIGETRASEAARQAIRSPLLEDVDIEGATGILINITAGSNISLMEVNEACSIIQDAAHEDANIIFGAVIDENCGEEIRVTVIATGFPADYEEGDDFPTEQLFGRKDATNYATSQTRTAAQKPAAQRTHLNSNAPYPTRSKPSEKPDPVDPAARSEEETFGAEDLTKLTFRSSEMQAKPETQAQNDIRTPSPAIANPTEVSKPAPTREIDYAAVSDQQQQFSQSEPNIKPTIAEEVPLLTQGSPAPEPTAKTVSTEADHASDPAPEPASPVLSAHVEEQMELSDSLTEPDDFDDDQPAGPPPMETFFTESASDFDRKIDEALELAERLRGEQEKQSDDANNKDELDIPAFLRRSQKDISLD